MHSLYSDVRSARLLYLGMFRRMGAGLPDVRRGIGVWGPVVLAVFGILFVGCTSSGSNSTSSIPKLVSTIPTTSSTTLPLAPSTSCPTSMNIGLWSDARLASQVIVVSAEIGSLSEMSQAFSSGVGGVVLMGNTSSPTAKSDLAKMMALVQGGVAPLIMTDEEGGGIEPFAALVGSMPWPRSMAQTMSTAEVASLTYKVGKALRSIGVTMDLAPVVDMDASPGPSNTDPDGSRSFSADPATVTKYAKAFESGLEKAGIIPVLKHFPGLGGSSGNTDFMPAHTLPYATLLQGGLIPFERLAPPAKAVMMSNASVPGLTNGIPASLSPQAVELLRNVIGFNGVIITDSLETVSISSYQPDLAKAVVDSAEAGNDLIMLASSNPNQMASYQSALHALTQAMAAGFLPRRTVEARVGRILALKGFPPSCIFY